MGRKNNELVINFSNTDISSHASVSGVQCCFYGVSS